MVNNRIITMTSRGNPRLSEVITEQSKEIDKLKAALHNTIAALEWYSEQYPEGVVPVDAVKLKEWKTLV